MLVEDLEWDERNEEHIARHGVDRDEVEAAITGAPLVTRGRSGAYRVIGQTDGGRYLTFIVVPRRGAFYVVTARDATTNERRAYRQRRGIG